MPNRISNQTKRFIKDEDNQKMLKQSLKSKDIDKDIVPIIKKFLTLPITSYESCYGHMAAVVKNPYLNYVYDKAKSEREAEVQRLFGLKIDGLSDRINERIGRKAIKTDLEIINHGGGPKSYTLRFNLVDTKPAQKMGKKLLDIIWNEFSKCLDELNKKMPN